MTVDRTFEVDAAPRHRAGLLRRGWIDVSNPADLRVIYRGKKVDLALKRVNLSDGSVGEREVVIHPGAVALLVLPDDDHLVLVRNRRHAVDETLVEVPAGTIDPGETPEQTAHREVREETGYSAATVERLAEWFV